MRRASLTVLLACVGALAFVACGEGETRFENPITLRGRADGGAGGPDAGGGGGDAGVDGGQGDAGVPGPTTGVRVVHAAPEVGAVDVYVAGSATPVATGLAYLQATGFMMLDAGTYALEVRPTGSPADAGAAITGEVTVAGPEQRFTVVAAGRLATTGAADALRLLTVEEAPEAMPGGDGGTEDAGTEDAGTEDAGTGDAGIGAPMARVVVVHAGADAPPVGLNLTGGNTPEPGLGAIARFAIVPPVGSAPLPAGQPLHVGVIVDGARVTSFSVPALTADNRYVVIATGLLSENPMDAQGFGLLLLGEGGVEGFLRQDALVHVLHASPDAPEAALFAGPAQQGVPFAFGELSSPLRLPAGQTVVDVFPAAAVVGGARPADALRALTASLTVEAGKQYLAVATGYASNAGPTRPALQLLPVASAFTRLPEDQAQAQVVHASPDANTVSVLVEGATPGTFTALNGLTAVPYASVAPATPLQLTPGAHLLGLGAENSTTPLVTFDATLAAGQKAFLVAAGALHPAGVGPLAEEGLTLLVVNTTSPEGFFLPPWEVTAVKGEAVGPPPP